MSSWRLVRRAKIYFGLAFQLLDAFGDFCASDNALIRKKFVDRFASILHGIAKTPSRITKNRITNSVEHGNFVSDSQYTLPAFVVQYDRIICKILIVGDSEIGASLIKRLDDFSGLRSCPSAFMASPRSVGSTPSATYF